MKLLGIAVIVMAFSPAWAQFGSAGAPPTMSGWGRTPGDFSGGMHSGRQFPGGRSRVIFLGDPWLDTDVPQASQPTVIVIQPQSVEAKAQEEPKPIHPLLIEWRGDRFVRTTTDSHQDSLPPEYALAKAEETPRIAKAANDEPVILIYRDGHRELVRDYSIIGGRLYTSADYIQSGSWMKTINLSALNLPATISLNRQTGANFVLPSGPNVVVTRP